MGLLRRNHRHLGGTFRDPVRSGFAAALSLALLLLPAAMAAAQQPAPDTPAPVVVVAPARQQEVAPAAEFVGRVEAIQAVDIRARVEGFLRRRAFQEGQDVRKGQLLFEIEPEGYEAALDAARAQVARAQATLSEAERALNRARELRASGTIPQAQLDEAQAQRDAARADLAEAQANLRTSELNLSYTKVVSPIDGRIGRTAFTEGNLVGPESDPLARVVQIDPIRVVFSISDRDLLEVQQEAGGVPREEVYGRFVPTLVLPDGTPYPEPGRVDFIANEIDPQTATIPVRAVFPNPNGLLLPGQIVSVRIRPARSERRLVVPVGAVQRDREGPFVLVIDEGNRVAERRIRLGPQIGQSWVVEEGLRAGERVVTEGIQAAVSPGAVVRPVPDEDDAASTNSDGP